MQFAAILKALARESLDLVRSDHDPRSGRTPHCRWSFHPLPRRNHAGRTRRSNRNRASWWLLHRHGQISACSPSFARSSAAERQAVLAWTVSGHPAASMLNAAFELLRGRNTTQSPAKISD